MKTTKYKIGNRDVKLNYHNCNVSCGDNLVLSDEKSDPTYNCHWYDKGFSVQNLFEENDFKKIHMGIQLSVKKIIESIQKKRDN